MKRKEIEEFLGDDYNRVHHLLGVGCWVVELYSQDSIFEERVRFEFMSDYDFKQFYKEV